MNYFIIGWSLFTPFIAYLSTPGRIPDRYDTEKNRYVPSSQIKRYWTTLIVVGAFWGVFFIMTGIFKAATS